MQHKAVRHSKYVPEGGDDIGGWPAHDEASFLTLGHLRHVIQTRRQPHLGYPHL